MSPKERLENFKRHLSRENLRIHAQDGLVSAQIGTARTGEWLRRRAMDTLNGAMGLSIIGIGSIFINTVTQNPSLSSLPSDMAPTLSQLGHLPLTDLNLAIHSIGNIAQSAWEIATVHFRDAGTHDLAAASFSLTGDGMLAELRHHFNVDERERRYIGGKYLTVRDVIPDRRRTVTPAPRVIDTTKG